METFRPRALSSRPMLAAVIPLPREEVTPPVTKTYFDMDRAPPGVFRMLPNMGPAGNEKPDSVSRRLSVTREVLRGIRRPDPEAPDRPTVRGLARRSIGARGDRATRAADAVGGFIAGPAHRDRDGA